MESSSLATYTRLSQQVTDRGPWQQTASGRAFFLGDPRPEEVNLQDIAHALAHQCRYNGHASEFYSVAQHAYLVAKWLEEDGYATSFVFAGLHHDSAEAYTGDIVSQVKYLVPEFRELEDRVEAAVFKALQVPMGPVEKAVTKAYDLLALSTEQRDLLPVNQTEFSWGDLPEPRAMTIHPWFPRYAQDMFLTKHHQLVDRMSRHAR